ncbi:nuclear RNA export factor 1-like isoform 2-T6 [Anomaloglossus baeobatrachus]|uniref:nuclear RNA export factor 1-like isoform X2 n=1 Tax=Anomaloglossus baeobatrachus TaxID=238106 RepID=UPI003F4F9486
MQENCNQLRVQLSGTGRRVVKGHHTDTGRTPYGSRWHKYEDREKVEKYSNQKCHKVKNVWFKITIPHGRNYNKMWLLTSIENECGFNFRAFQFHYVNNMAAFFVDNFSTARSLVQVSQKIQDAQYHKIVIKVEPFNEQMEKRNLSPLIAANSLQHAGKDIQSCLRKRYNKSLRSLDLSDLENDPDLLSANIVFSVSHPPAAEIILQIISEYYPQLQSLNLSHNHLSNLTGFAPLLHLTPRLQSLNLSYNKLYRVQELDLINNLELRELWLKGNPLRGAVESCSAYYRLVTYHFPSIEKLDGLFFKENLHFELEKPKPLPQAKGSYFVNNDIKMFLAKFLHQYFTLYDSGDRKALLPLYHENSCCSFSLPKVYYPRAAFNQLKEYWKENRNLLRVMRADVRRQLIKYNRLQVVGFLCNLPKTEHELGSLMLDVSFQSPSLICFTIEGQFKEVNVSGHMPPVFSFRRTFLIVPAYEDSAQILNDQMVIMNTYLGPLEAPSSDPHKSTMVVCKQGHPLVASETVLSFSEYTRMKPDWALKCLQDNNLDVQKAKEIFHLLKNQGAIPPEAFQVKELAAIVSE